MSIPKILILLTCINYYYCDKIINNIFEDINEKILKFSQISAEITWESSVNPGNIEVISISEKYQKKRIPWQHATCDRLAALFYGQLLNSTQQRQTYLLCRGPEYTFEEARETSKLYKELQDTYNVEVCIPSGKNISESDISDKKSAILSYLSNFTQQTRNNEKLHRTSKLSKDQIVFLASKSAASIKKTNDTQPCLEGEAEFDRLMSYSKEEEVLRWLWMVWREKTGPKMKGQYRRLVDIENIAARRNQYRDIGASWRDELEIPNLRILCRNLYKSIRPLYTLLHGVVRFHLRRFYGSVVPEKGPIPAHLLGNLWSQNWEHLSKILVKKDIDLDSKIKRLNWTVPYMLKRAEDYYQSVGLPAMTDAFWRESVFTRENNNAAKCHGAAADMFKDGDYRLLYCSGVTKDDFSVIHHELGHIQYYMAYANQPALLRQANAALHETIGDAMMYGVMAPQHLYRLGLITDEQLYTPNSKDKLSLSNDVKNDTKLKEENSNNGVNGNSDIVNINVNYPINENYESVFEVYQPKHKYNSKTKMNSKDTTSFTPEEKYKNDHTYHPHGYNLLNYLQLTKSALLEKLILEENLRHHSNLNSGNELYSSIALHPNIKLDLNTDEILLLRQALNKIPQIPFALLLDEYRWKYFEGALKNPNKEFWQMSLELQGISPPNERGEEYFDAGAKFHVPDNTPYIRYFLSSFLQHQLFESLCKVAIFGRRDVNESIPDTIPLNRCDLYGSKVVGKVLADIMSRGHSQHWTEILQSTVNITEISSEALERYYRPLQQKLLKHVQEFNIPIGW